MSFVLDNQLQKDCITVGELSLSRLLLMNDAQYPWFILVPRVADITEMYELNAADQQTLWTEIAHISRVIKETFQPDKINIGALGNVVSQLHVHVIGRSKTDAAWPGPVWGALPAKPYSRETTESIMHQIKQAIPELI